MQIRITSTDSVFVCESERHHVDGEVTSAVEVDQIVPQWLYSDGLVHDDMVEYPQHGCTAL